MSKVEPTVEAIVRYHDRSTHRPGRFAAGPGHLDWANQPEPFRSYEGAPVVELPLCGEDLTATWAELHRPGDVAPRSLDLGALGAFLELALGLTAWKEAGASRWALRANPSSGNLHPTEGYVLVADAPGLPSGVSHYRSVDHVLERRASLESAATSRLAGWLPESGFLVGLASIHWREAWKYGERAFRYCQHDAGHALATVRYAAAVLGWSAQVLDVPGDEDVAAVLGLDRDDDDGTLASADREHPDALVLVAPAPLEIEAVRRFEGALDEMIVLLRQGEWAGRPNTLSLEHVEWPEIDEAAHATRKPRTPDGVAKTAPSPVAAAPVKQEAHAVSLIRARRSAVAMDGVTSMPRAAFFETMWRLLPRPGVPPWDVLPWTPRVHPVLFVHRVPDLPPGLYVLQRDPGAHEALREAMRKDLRWERPKAAPEGLPLFLLEEGDARSFARFASCQQAIASESAFSLGMLSLFEESLEGGAWWYRRLFWETGVLGQVLYMEAEALGFRGTGIGCYFDDVVHETLGLHSRRFRDLYHFTIGGPVEDTRLATRPAYAESVHGRGQPEGSPRSEAAGTSKMKRDPQTRLAEAVDGSRGPR